MIDRIFRSFHPINLVNPVNPVDTLHPTAASPRTHRPASSSHRASGSGAAPGPPADPGLRPGPKRRSVGGPPAGGRGACGRRTDRRGRVRRDSVPASAAELLLLGGRRPAVARRWGSAERRGELFTRAQSLATDRARGAGV